MKIGIRADTLDNGYGRWGKDTYKKVREHGYTCSYFNMANTDSLIYTLSKDESDAFLLNERRLAEHAGVEIEQVHGPWRWPPQDFTAEDRLERKEKMIKSIRATSILGCKNWVIHPLMPFGTSDILDNKQEETWQINLSFMRELLLVAKDYGVTICLENMPMPDFSMAKPEKVLEFVNEINDDNFKICLDTGHVNIFPELDLAEETIRLRKKIQTLHVHDNRTGSDFHFMPHFGDIDWDKFVKALKSISYNGCFNLETCPPKTLGDDIFDDTCKILFKIAKKIVDNY